MKKVLLSLGVIATALTASAQITVTSANLPAPFDATEIATDTLIDPNVISIGNAGTNQTWDFSSLTPDIISAVNYLDPASTPYAAKFPSATLAMGSEQTGYTYFRTGTDGVYMVGTEGGFINGTYDPELTVVKMDVTFSDSYSDQGTLTTGGFSDFTGTTTDSIRAVITTDRDVIVDAWGTVILPNKSFPSLRLDITETMDMTIQKKSPVLGWQDDPILTATYAQLFGFPTTEQFFEWYTNEAGVINTLTTMRLDSIGQPVRAEYYPSNPVGINELPNATVSVYPNPASDMVTLELNEAVNGYAKVYNLNGQVVATQLMNGTSISIALGSIANGTYFVNIMDANGSVKSVNKINVAH